MSTEPLKEKNPAAVALGKLSGPARVGIPRPPGHQAWRANKRWKKYFADMDAAGIPRNRTRDQKIAAASAAIEADIQAGKAMDAKAIAARIFVSPKLVRLLIEYMHRPRISIEGLPDIINHVEMNPEDFK